MSKKTERVNFYTNPELAKKIQELADKEHRRFNTMAEEIIRRFFEGETVAKGNEPISIEGIKGEDRDILYIANNLKNKEDYRQWKRQGIYYLKNPTEGQGLIVSESVEPKTKRHSK